MIEHAAVHKKSVNMSNEENLINNVEAKLEAIDKDWAWLAERLSVSEETVRVWMDGKQEIPDNKRLILEVFVSSGGRPSRPQGASREMLPPEDIINQH